MILLILTPREKRVMAVSFLLSTIQRTRRSPDDETVAVLARDFTTSCGVDYCNSLQTAGEPKFIRETVANN